MRAGEPSRCPETPATRDATAQQNASAAQNAGGGTTAADLSRQGRITGYTLDYVAAGLRCAHATKLARGRYSQLGSGRPVSRIPACAL